MSSFLAVICLILPACFSAAVKNPKTISRDHEQLGYRLFIETYGTNFVPLPGMLNLAKPEFTGCFDLKADQNGHLLPSDAQTQYIVHMCTKPVRHKYLGVLYDSQQFYIEQDPKQRAKLEKIVAAVESARLLVKLASSMALQAWQKMSAAIWGEQEDAIPQDRVNSPGYEMLVTRQHEAAQHEDATGTVVVKVLPHHKDYPNAPPFGVAVLSWLSAGSLLNVEGFEAERNKDKYFDKHYPTGSWTIRFIEEVIKAMGVQVLEAQDQALLECPNAKRVRLDFLRTFEGKKDRSWYFSKGFKPTGRRYKDLMENRFNVLDPTNAEAWTFPKLEKLWPSEKQRAKDLKNAPELLAQWIRDMRKHKDEGRRDEWLQNPNNVKSRTIEKPKDELVLPWSASKQMALHKFEDFKDIFERNGIRVTPALKLGNAMARLWATVQLEHDCVDYAIAFEMMRRNLDYFHTLVRDAEFWTNKMVMHPQLLKTPKMKEPADGTKSMRQKPLIKKVQAKEDYYDVINHMTSIKDRLQEQIKRLQWN